MDVEEKLFTLMAIADEHQSAVGQMLEALKSDRIALAAERASLEDATQKVIQSIKTYQRAVEEAASKAVQESLSDASKTSVQAFHEASRPFFHGLRTATSDLTSAGKHISEASALIGWKLSLVAFVSVAVAGLAGWAGIWWVRNQVEPLRAEKTALQLDVAQLNIQVAELARRGGRMKFSTCGPASRLCIQASSNQGDGFGNWKGPWTDHRGTQQYVIPQGY